MKEKLIVLLVVLSFVLSIYLGIETQFKARTMSDGEIWAVLEKDPARFWKLLMAAEKQARFGRMVSQWERIPNNAKRPLISAGRASIGSKKAPVKIVEYSNFMCSHCAKQAKVMHDIAEQSGGQVRVILKHLPFNSKARQLAYIFEGVVKVAPEKAWLFGEKLYEQRLAVFSAPEKVATLILQDLKIDVDQVKKVSMSPEVQKRVKDDIEEARLLGIRGTPTMYVGNIPLRGGTAKSVILQAVEFVKKRDS